MVALVASLGGAAVGASPVIGQETADDATEVRIVARKLANGRVEFGLQQRQTDNSWGDRQLPRSRFFPTTATTGRWLASSSLTLGSQAVVGATSGTQGYTAIAGGSWHSCAMHTDGAITCWREIRSSHLPVD